MKPNITATASLQLSTTRLKSAQNLIAFLAALLLTFGPALHAGPAHELMYGFGIIPQNPSPGALVLGSDGYYWGATTNGGLYSCGTIYKMKADGSHWQLVLSFTGNGSNNKGASPNSGLVTDDAGFFWGTTQGGGRFGYGAGNGTVFKINPTTGELTTVVEFTGNSPRNKGASPQAGLVDDGAGHFWGTTSEGGAHGFGTVFKIDRSTGVFTTVVDFTYNDGLNKGASPYAKMVRDGAGFLWGTTSRGGLSGNGTVFKINESTGALTTLVEFTGTDGANKGADPRASLTSDGAGYFWGTTAGGGANEKGTVFKINQNTVQLTTLVEFTGSVGNYLGASPWAGLLNDGLGYFWGTTNKGGAWDDGTVFRINQSTGAILTVVSFNRDAVINAGANPAADLVNDGQGYLWGTTASGGAYYNGTVFKIRISTGQLTTLLGFTPFNSHFEPRSGLVSDGQSSFLGTTSGNSGVLLGTVFKLNQNTGALDTLSAFTGPQPGKQGANPYAGLANDGAGFFWGTTLYGGTNNHGTVFKVNQSTGELINLVKFTGTGSLNKGSRPYAGLVSDGAGFFWGTTTEGGAPSAGHTHGTVFKIDQATAELTTLVEFTGTSGGNKGSRAEAGLVSDGAGYFWGMTAYGGAHNKGTVFKINQSTGELTTLLEFTDNGLNNKGAVPKASLVSDGAGFFWGTTSEGGAGYGTVFKIEQSTGVLTTLAAFTGNGATNKGTFPIAALTDDGAGFFWGTTSKGGASDNGTVFKINQSTGELTTLLEFAGNGRQVNCGSNPGYGPLLKHTDGNFYGTTTNGGPGMAGTVFRLRNGPTPVTLPAIAVTATSATLMGTVNPNDNGSTAVTFEYSTSPTLAGALTISGTTLASGSTAVAVSAPISGLVLSSTYYFRITGSNAGNSVKQEGMISNFIAHPNTPPEVELLGDNPLTFEAAVGYSDSGAIAGDTEDGPINPAITSNTVVANVTGTYLVTWVATDGGLLTGTATRTVHVVDTTAPAISGSFSPLSIVAGTPLPDYTNQAETSDIVGVTSVTQSPAPGSATISGTLEVTLIAHDAAGNSGTTSFAITANNTAPQVTLTGSNPLTFEAAATYMDPGATATDVQDGPLTPSITSNTVVPNVTGTFVVAWTATDSSLLTGTATRTVNVVDTTAPTISGPFFPLAITAGTPLADYTGQALTSDIVGVANVAQSPAPGTTTAVGTLNITLTASDAAGNSADTSFAVTVVPTSPNVSTEQYGAVGSGQGSPVPGEPDGVTFRRLGVPFINDAGTLAYVANLKLSPTTAATQDVIFSGTAVAVREGNTIPGGSAETFHSFHDPVLADDGAVGFIGKMAGPNVTKANDHGAWMKSSGTFTQIVREGAILPGSPAQARLKRITSMVLRGSGTTHTAYFSGRLTSGGVQPTNDHVIYRWSEGAGLALVLLEGNPLTLQSGNTKTVKTWSLLGNIPISSGQARGSTTEDAVTFQVTFTDGTQALVDASPGGGVVDFAATGTSVSGTTPALKWRKVGPVATSDNGSAAFLGTLQTGTGGVISSNATGIFLADALGDSLPVIRTSATTPGITGGQFFALQDPTLSPVSLDLTFVGTARGPGIKSANDTGVWWQPDGAPLQLVAREGDTLPGAADFSKLEKIKNLACSDRGPLFAGQLHVGPGGITSTTNNILWGMDLVNTLQKLLAEGDSLAVGTGTKTVRSFHVLKASPGSYGVRRSFTASGEFVALRATFTDGSQAIVKITLP